MRRRSRQEVSSFFAANTSNDLLRFQFYQNLDQIIRRNIISIGKILRPECLTALKMTRQPKHGTSGVVAFDGEFHGRAKYGLTMRGASRFGAYGSWRTL